MKGEKRKAKKTNRKRTGDVRKITERGREAERVAQSERDYNTRWGRGTQAEDPGSRRELRVDPDVICACKGSFVDEPCLRE